MYEVLQNYSNNPVQIKSNVRTGPIKQPPNKSEKKIFYFKIFTQTHRNRKELRSHQSAFLFQFNCSMHSGSSTSKGESLLQWNIH